MKSSTSIIVLILLLFSALKRTNAQDNPWNKNRNANPWTKADSINYSIQKDTIQIITQPQKEDSIPIKEESTPFVGTSSQESIPRRENEILFRYSSTNVLLNENSGMLKSEIKNHVRHSYKSSKMFWTNFGLTVGSMTTSILSGNPIGLLGLVSGIIASGSNSRGVKKALERFIADNPNADPRIIRKYKRKLRSKKIASGIGGIGAGLGATAATGLVVVLILVATL